MQGSAGIVPDPPPRVGILVGREFVPDKRKQDADAVIGKADAVLALSARAREHSHELRSEVQFNQDRTRKAKSRHEELMTAIERSRARLRRSRELKRKKARK